MSVLPSVGAVQVLPEVLLRRQVHVHTPRDHVQIRRDVQQAQLCVQALCQAQPEYDAVQPAHAHAVDEHARSHASATTEEFPMMTPHLCVNDHYYLLFLNSH